MKKLIKPEPPLDWIMESFSISLYQGMDLQEILDRVPEAADKSKIEFDISPTYYDDFDYVFVGSYKRKLTEKEYARKVAQYEKALKKYNDQEKKD